ncbi:MAG TPA: hypothetical protein VFB54_15990 [Burkholderiales bacterium]|nr:hypothetical protein [Burkholderiales bacterium]
MNSLTTLTKLLPLDAYALQQDPRIARMFTLARAWWKAFYFHALPHPLSEVLYWDLLYVVVRLMRSFGNRSNASGQRDEAAAARQGLWRIWLVRRSNAPTPKTRLEGEAQVLCALACLGCVAGHCHPRR